MFSTRYDSWRFKDSNRKKLVDKLLRDKAFNSAKNPKYDGYQCALAWMVYDFFDKKNSGWTIKNEIISNKKLLEELHEPIIRKFNKRKLYSFFSRHCWGAQVADMKLIRKFNKEI